MADIETIHVDSKEIACDGGGTLGHPMIYLNMGENHEITCPYCSRTFVLNATASK